MKPTPRRTSFRQRADGGYVIYRDYALRDIRFLLPHRGGRVATTQRTIAGLAAAALSVAAVCSPAAWTLPLAVPAIVLAVSALADGLWAGRTGKRQFNWAWAAVVTTRDLDGLDPGTVIMPGAGFWIETEEYRQALRWRARTRVYAEDAERQKVDAGMLPARALRWKNDPPTRYRRRLIILVQAGRPLTRGLRAVRDHLPDRAGPVAGSQRAVAAGLTAVLAVTAVISPAGGTLAWATAGIALGAATTADGLWARWARRHRPSRSRGLAVLTRAVPGREPGSELPAGAKFWAVPREFARARRWHGKTRAWAHDSSPLDGQENQQLIPARALRWKYEPPPRRRRRGHNVRCWCRAPGTGVAETAPVKEQRS